PWYSLSLIGDSLMDERLLFYLGHAWYQMSEISECLDTASRIEAGDVAGWRREWFHTADRLRSVAETSLAGGHDVSAGESYLRATSYYLAGLIYADSPTDPDVPRNSRASAECFEQALRLLKIPGEPVQIPYEDSILPAYYFRAGDDPAPLVIVHQGMDASIEETYFIAQGAVARGYHCLMFHHPGQGRALREYGLTFRPDWENVVTPVVDFALQLPGVDADRIALLGLSFGGALVLRAAAYEQRIKICISNPPVYDWGGFIHDFLFGQYPQMADLLEQDPEAFNVAIMQFLDAAPSMYRWWFSSALWKYGQATPAQLLEHLKGYSLDGVLEKVTCKVLIMDGEAEAYGTGDGPRVHDLLADSDYMLFTAEDTGLLHNQTAALAVANQRMFDWLDENI
ncbi:MAG: alpha/beta hydrolase, partial [Anaerolineae bacterium]|nr:alpha/beta hydrolase [Anaerolineae bacterium]